MTEREVVLDFVPRSQFLPFHRRKQRWACLICHRRCGKTFATLMDLLLKALRTPHGRFAYVAPYYNQAKTVAWDVKQGEPTRVGIPPSCALPARGNYRQTSLPTPRRK
jgi:Terminase large subunit, T4likevirus-type, N-terminal